MVPQMLLSMHTDLWYTPQIWMRVFPDIPVSSKPAEVRMGKGKGYVVAPMARFVLYWLQ